MDITPELHESAPLISRYGNGGFVIGGVRTESSVLLGADFSLTLSVRLLKDLEPSVFEPLLSGDYLLPEIMLVGTGAQPAPLPQALKDWLEQHSIGYDVMDTGAACRTFNILLAEERRVAALLIAV